MSALEAISTLDPPFLAPLECVVDLPFPPSTNDLWAHRKGTRGELRPSAVYAEWKRQADMAVVANGTWRRRQRMPAHFTAEIGLDCALRKPNFDADNRIKAVLDWAQRVEIIRNDCLCDDVRARWVEPAEAPHGARLILRSIA